MTHVKTTTGIENAIEINGDESTLLVNSTSANNINPGDIRKLMSTPKQVKPIPTIAKKVSLKSELNINGKTYLEAGKYVIYYLSKVIRSSAD